MLNSSDGNISIARGASPHKHFPHDRLCTETLGALRHMQPTDGGRQSLSDGQSDILLPPQPRWDFSVAQGLAFVVARRQFRMSDR